MKFDINEKRKYQTIEGFGASGAKEKKRQSDISKELPVQEASGVLPYINVSKRRKNRAAYARRLCASGLNKRRGLASAEHALAHSLRPRRLMRSPLPNKNITRRKNEVKRCTKYFEQRAI